MITRTLNPRTEFTRVVTDMVRLSISQKLKDHVFLDFKCIERLAEPLAYEFVYQLDAYLNGKQQEVEHTEITYPIDWFEAFKERWLPVWLLKKYPVKYQTHKIVTKITKICPHLDVPNDVQSHLVWLMREEKVDDFQDDCNGKPRPY